MMNVFYNKPKLSFWVAILTVGFLGVTIQGVSANTFSKIPEQSAFGIAPVLPHPDPQSKQYITKTVQFNETPMNFNGETNKTTQSIVLSGHVLVFEPEHENGLWESYHNHKTLKDLEIHADTVIIRSALRLPQTNVTVYARNLRFEDTSETASINTMPYSKTIVAAPQQKGLDGNPGGDVTLHVSNAFLGNTSLDRLILDGGTGQEGGQGTAGKDASNTKIWTGKIKRTSGIKFKEYTFTSANNATYVIWPQEGLLNFGDIKRGDSNEKPRNGADAKPSGISGKGGKGGDLVAGGVIDWINTVSKVGGAGGKAAAFVKGGTAGKPSRVYHWKCTWDGGCKTTKTLTGKPGKSYSRSSGAMGEEGQYVKLDTQFSWLTAPLFSQSLRYSKDMYLYGYYDDVEIYLNGIINIVKAYQASPEWNQLDDLNIAELNQLLDEAEGLRHRLNSGLDYFSKPLGWVPGLSFEVNQSVYNNEIDNAMDVLWLTHSMQQNINDKQARKGFAQKMVTTLNNEISGFKTQYQQANNTITNLEPRINQLSTDTENLKLKLNQRAEALRSKAEEAAFLNGIRDTLLKVTEFIPAANLATRVAFELPNIDPNKPVLNELATITKDASWATANQVAENKQEISDCIGQTGDPKKCAIAKGVRESQEGSDLAKKQGQLALDLISGNTANNDAVNAELQRILAEDPRWLGLTEDIQALHTKKATLVADLIAALDTVNKMSASINKNLLAIDVFHQDVINATDLLDPRMIVYTKDMAQRARHRLEQYQYYLVRSYEYRMVKAYPFSLDLNSIFDDFCKLLAAKESNNLDDVINEGCDAADVELSEGDFKSLGAIYKEQMSSITEDIILDYNTSGGVSQDTAVEFDMPTQYLSVLSQNPVGVKLNLVEDLDLFNSSEEDIRIRSIEITDLQFSSPNQLNYVDVCFIHSGVSAIRTAGETYLFQHYINSETRPIQWLTRYNGNGTRQGLQTDSNSSKSLIGAIIGNNSENLKIFASPAAWADLRVKRSASPDFSTDSVNITRMRVRVNYEYTPTETNIKTLKIAAESITKAPPIDVQTPDLKGRVIGSGNFFRSYPAQKSVILNAPATYGALQFVSWKENGVLVSNSPTIQVVMDRNKTLLPIYKSLIEGASSQLFELSAITLDGLKSSTRIYAGAINAAGINARQLGLSEVFDIKSEFHVGAEFQGKVTDIYIVASYNGTLFMKDRSQNWLIWDGTLNGLVANTTQQLSAVTPVSVVQGLSGLPGSFSIFVGHSSEGGNIHYNSEALNFSVQ